MFMMERVLTHNISRKNYLRAFLGPYDLKNDRYAEWCICDDTEENRNELKINT